MSIPQKYLAALEPDNYYHIYNRTNNGEPLFRTPDNYRYFLKVYTRYIRPVCKTFSWCLLPNHFHLLLQARPIEALYDHLLSLPEEHVLAQIVRRGGMPGAHAIISNGFRQVFTAYAMAYNNTYKRSGNLFYRPFKRLLIGDERQLVNTAIYVHTNPKHHGLSIPYESYPWSSYNIIPAHPRLPEPAFLLDLFGGMDNYHAAHRERADVIPETLMEG